MQRAYSHGRALTDLLQKVMVDMPTQATLDVLHEVSEARQDLPCCCGSKDLAVFSFVPNTVCQNTIVAAPKKFGSVCIGRQTNAGRRGISFEP